MKWITDIYEYLKVKTEGWWTFVHICVCMYVGAYIYLDMGRGQKTTTVLFLWCLVFLLFVLFLKQAESLAWKFAKQTTLTGQQAPGINLLLPTQCLNSTSMPPRRVFLHGSNSGLICTVSPLPTKLFLQTFLFWDASQVVQTGLEFAIWTRMTLKTLNIWVSGGGPCL